MWIEFNPNPFGRRVGDCAVRAVAKALDVSWDTAYAMIAAKGFLLGDVPSSNSVWGAVLKEHGFKREAVPDSCPDCYTAEDFCRDHPLGLYVLGFNSHVAVVESGNLFDAYDSSREVPQYLWKREETE